MERVSAPYDWPMREESPARRRWGVAIAVGVLILDLLMQVYLIVLGVWLLVVDDTTEQTSLALFAWCAWGTLYCFLAILVVGLSVRWRPRTDSPVFHWVDQNPVTRFISSAATFLASFAGLLSAFLVIAAREDEQWRGVVGVLGLWAMLLAWALFHWGYSRTYARFYQRAVERGGAPPLAFPGDEKPHLPDFVYFAFTNGTTFAATDVAVTTTRMRWTVLWHSVFSFFFNALIIVLAVNTIADGHLFDASVP